MNIHHLTGFLSQSLRETGNQRTSSFSKKCTNTAVLTGGDFSVYPTGIFQLKGNTDDKIWDETGFNHDALGFPVYILNRMVILT